MIRTLLTGPGAVWLGILTSLSPCPLAGNIAAICYVTGGGGKCGGKSALSKGVLYTLGRMLAYVLLAVLLTWSSLSVPVTARFLETHMNRLLGPFLILTGAVLVGWVRIPTFGTTAGERLRRWTDHAGRLGAGLMGFILALSFCPVSAALFFGALIPLSLKNGSPLLIPMLFGLGTALPVVGAAVAVAMGVDVIDRFFERAQAADRWTRMLTGWALVCIGLFFVWNHLVVPFTQAFRT